MSRPSFVPKLERCEDRVTPWGGFSNPFKAAKDAVSDAVHAAVQAPAAIVQSTVQTVTHPVQTVAQAVTNPVKPVVQTVRPVVHEVAHTAQTVAKKTEQVAHSAKQTAEHAGKKTAAVAKQTGHTAEKVGQETKKGAEKVGKAVKDGYKEIKPVVQVAAPIVVGAVVTVYTGGNIYAGVAAASVTSSLLSGERDPKDIAVNVAKAEAVAFIGGQVAGQFAEVAADGTTVSLTTVQSVEAAAVTSVATDVVVNGETDPEVLLQHAAVAGATSYADGEVAKLGLGRPAETVVTTGVNQVIQSHGHIDPQAILVNAGGTLLGTEVGEYLKPVFSGAAEPVLVPEGEEGAEQLPSPPASTSEDGNQAQASPPAEVVIPGNETGNVTASVPGTEQKLSSSAEPPKLAVSSEMEQSPVPSDFAELPVLTEPAPSQVVAEFATPKTEPVVQNTPLESWLVDAANSIQATEDAVMGHVQDFATGATNAAYEMALGLETLGRLTPSSPNYDPVFSYNTARGVAEALFHGADVTVNDPAKAWDAIRSAPGQVWGAVSGPYVDAWNAGHPMEAIGRGVVEFGPVLLDGLSLLGKAGQGAEAVAAGSRLGEAERVAASAGRQMPESFAEFMDSAEKLPGSGRVTGDFAHPMQLGDVTPGLDDVRTMGESVSEAGRFLAPVVKAPTARTLSEWLPGLSDDALIHLTDATAAQLKPGVFADSYWVRFGDVKHLTVPRYKAEVVLPLAPAHATEAKVFAVIEKPDLKLFNTSREQDVALEFQNTKPIVPDKIIEVDPLPAVPPPWAKK